jgi:hypothetical protein
MWWVPPQEAAGHQFLFPVLSGSQRGIRRTQGGSPLPGSHGKVL